MVAVSAVMNGEGATRDVASEEFLFHLYRGSELLQDNRVHEAKEELEHALTLQPRDPKGQDLLGVVYFRIGLYPRAIHIYEQLKRDNPKDPSLKLNLALCYLKTGQTQAARFELEDVVRAQPTHKRAWGYLGLAHERLGDLEKAMTAFERGGHTAMARRVAEKIDASARNAAPFEHPVQREAAAVFEELDAGEISFSLAEPATPPLADSGTWSAVEIGATPATRSVRKETLTVPPSARAASLRASERAARAPQGDADPDEDAPVSSRVPSLPSGEVAAAAIARINGFGAYESTRPESVPRIGDVGRRAMLVFPKEPGVSLHPSGIALVRTTAATDGARARGFAVRLEAIRSQYGALAAEVMQRTARGKATGETLGGLGSPIVEVEGAGELVVAPRASHRIVAFRLEDETTYVREDVVLGFETTLDVESGKLPLGDGDAAPVLQLQGRGAVLLEAIDGVHALEIQGARPVLVRREVVLGWTGRVTARVVPLSEAPSGQRGLLAFAGEGSLFVALS